MAAVGLVVVKTNTVFLTHDISDGVASWSNIFLGCFQSAQDFFLARKMEVQRLYQFKYYWPLGHH